MTGNNGAANVTNQNVSGSISGVRDSMLQQQQAGFNIGSRSLGNSKVDSQQQQQLSE